eukprot:6251884-Pyramimonas_sp.AAC.1
MPLLVSTSGSKFQSAQLIQGPAREQTNLLMERMRGVLMPPVLGAGNRLADNGATLPRLRCRVLGQNPSIALGLAERRRSQE